MPSLFRPKGYLRPTTVTEAACLLEKYGKKARVIAGGTDLLVEKPPEVEYLVDITRLPLGFISRYEKGIEIGALATFNSIKTSPVVSAEGCVVLAETAGEMGNVAIRNMGTVGGNLCNGIPSADFPPALISMDAKVQIACPSGKRSLPLEEFYLDVRKTALKRGELLVRVQVPSPSPDTGAAFFKLGRTYKDIALVNVAVRVTLEPSGVCGDVKIVLGAVAPTPLRAWKAERILKGDRLDDALLEKMGKAASESSRPITDVRASADYRRKVTRVLVKRAVRQAWNRARRE